MIAIIDYGAGNLHSVQKALNFLKIKNKIVQNYAELKGVEKIILPGVGHFGDVAKKLKSSDIYPFLVDWIEKDKPFLGICVGLQFLMQKSQEDLETTGFGLFEGTNEKFTLGKVPQIGWNKVNFLKEIPLFKDIPQNSYFYFVHSYYPKPINDENVLAIADYYIKFPCVLGKSKVYGVQFHPEKSGELGLKLLKNWVGL